ncbi:MAG TPA: SCO family protein [Bryobacteraceae bacterium]|jgi:protein SCO1/2|nr:SCO family protein [Bryobacteraceae bacterium]
MKKTLGIPIAFIFLLSACAREKPLPVLGEIPQFQLLNQQGKKFDRSSLDGHVWVADFIYTNCEGPCPRMSSRMHGIQKATDTSVKLVSFTVDPARDTPQALEAYGRKFAADDSRWTFLTGETATLNMLDHDAFKLGNVSAILDHSTRFVLIDKQGRVRGYYGLVDGDPVARVAKDAARLEAESDQYPGKV